jgi:hypothetical protein
METIKEIIDMLVGNFLLIIIVVVLYRWLYNFLENDE